MAVDGAGTRLVIANMGGTSPITEMLCRQMPLSVDTIAQAALTYPRWISPRLLQVTDISNKAKQLKHADEHIEIGN